MSNNNENNTTTVDFSKLRDFIKENNEYNKTIKKKKKKIVVFFINVITIVSLIAGGIGIKLLLDYKEDQEETKKLQQELADKKETIISMVEQDIQKEIDEIPVVNPKITELFDSLLKDNNDAVAWLKLNNTDIDTPIVQSDNNEYYLNHNFNKKYNEIGWTFTDYRNNFPDLSTNTIIYGHTYRNSTLAFSSLKKVLNKSWYDNEENQIIYLTTTEKELKFKIFSIYTIKNTNDYLKINMNKEEFNVFIANALERSVKNFNTEVKYGDKILTLSTCYNTSNYRLVVHAKLVEDDYE